MDPWDQAAYLEKAVAEVQTLIQKGISIREILDNPDLNLEVLRMCGLPASYLVPHREGQCLSPQEWDTHTSSEGKWEYFDSQPFGDRCQRDRVLLGLLYSMGFDYLLSILPQESVEALYEAILAHNEGIME